MFKSILDAASYGLRFLSGPSASSLPARSSANSLHSSPEQPGAGCFVALHCVEAVCGVASAGAVASTADVAVAGCAGAAC